MSPYESGKTSCKDFDHGADYNALSKHSPPFATASFRLACRTNPLTPSTCIACVQLRNGSLSPSQPENCANTLPREQFAFT